MKIKHYQSYLKENYNNIRKTWDGIKSISNISNMKSMSPSSLNVNNKINTNPVDNANCFSSLNVNNKINTNPVDIANCFNDYFSNTGSKFAEKIFPSKYDHLHYLKCSNPVSIFIKPTSTIEILNLISTLNNNKSSGPFSIPTDIFKMTGNIMASPLTEIINLSFSTGIYPNNLKIAK